MFKKIITLLNKMIPKNNIILFCSNPTYSDNAKYLYQYIVQNRKDITRKYRIFWGIDDLDSNSVNIPNCTCIEKKSFKGLIIFLTAKYIFSTHDYFSNIKSGNGQIQVNLWHGIGYKKIPDNDKAYRGDYTISTNKYYIDIQSDALCIDRKNIPITGLPRNDLLYKKTNCLAELGIQKNEYNSVMIWMPTYRKAVAKHEGIDGNIEGFGLLSFLKNQASIIDDICNEKKVLLIIKPHPMEDLSGYEMQRFHNIVFVKNEDLENRKIELYSLLTNTDILISDYSSVIVDYLLLDKPIAIVCSDMDEYRENRGFVVNPIDEYLPGPILSSLDDFEDYIRNYENYNSNYIMKRQKLKCFFHNYQDMYSCKRVCEYFFGKD